MGSARTVELLTVFVCPVCQTEQQVPACFGGKRGRCATCGGVIRVPSGRDRVRSTATLDTGTLDTGTLDTGTAPPEHHGSLLKAGLVGLAILAWSTCAGLLVLLLRELLG